MSIHVNADNFVRAETDRMFADIQRDAGGVNTFRHNREPAPIEGQTVIRLNRDTLYSFAIVDLSEGATLVIPDADGRYLSVMVLDQRHHVRAVVHDAGTYELRDLAPDADYVLVAARTLVDPHDPSDLAVVARLQDAIQLEARSSRPFEMPDYDAASLDATRSALLSLAAGLRGFDRMFGGEDDVDPVRHLIGAAAGWGGLPITEASYVGVAPQQPVGFYDLTMRDVPVDAFWSVSVYNAQGYFEPNAENRYTVNSVTGVPDEDGAITVRFTPPGEATAPNSIPLPEGWNYLVRLYRPRPEFLDGSWHVPDLIRRADLRATNHASESADERTDASPLVAAEATAEPGAGAAESGAGHEAAPGPAEHGQQPEDGEHRAEPDAADNEPEVAEHELQHDAGAGEHASEHEQEHGPEHGVESEHGAESEHPAENETGRDADSDAADAEASDPDTESPEAPAPWVQTPAEELTETHADGDSPSWERVEDDTTADVADYDGSEGEASDLDDDTERVERRRNGDGDDLSRLP